MLCRSAFSYLFTAWLLTFAGHSFAGTITHHSFDSATLERVYEYNIYLPDGYASDNLAYPVLYLRHGSNGSENDWPVNGILRCDLNSAGFDELCIRICLQIF